jgi:2-polyprenyl-3-methyl-5-hydroxy-6-metoxy-1,4-benzoquinol methylase
MAIVLKKKSVEAVTNPTMPASEWEAPKRHKLDKEDRKFDQTQLRAASYGHQVHRDYAAHFFRWGFSTNFVKLGCEVLDVGCGQDLPLVNVLIPRMSNIPKRYVGVDMNRVSAKPPRWATIHQEFDFTSRSKEIPGEFDVIVNFEVIEHMKKEDGAKLLRAMRGKLREGSGRLLLSTPVYNEKHMAKNHVHEYRYEELADWIASCGLEVESVHGTFMTSQAMKRVMSKEEGELVERLHEFHSWDVLACFLAPKYPEASSNCCWVCKKAGA